MGLQSSAPHRRGRVCRGAHLAEGDGFAEERTSQKGMGCPSTEMGLQRSSSSGVCVTSVTFTLAPSPVGISTQYEPGLALTCGV
eukprot:849439-Pyramimonas_sp.AAC.1